MPIFNKLYRILKYTYNKIYNMYEYFSTHNHKLLETDDEYEIVNDILKHY